MAGKDEKTGRQRHGKRAGGVWGGGTGEETPQQMTD